MIKNLKYLLFIFIVFITFNVSAADYNYSNKIYYSPGSAPGTYSADEILLGGTSGPYSFGTTYQGCISKMEFYLDSTSTIIDSNTKYKVTLNMANNDWRNRFMGPNVFRANLDGSIPSSASNMYVSSSLTFVSYKKIYFYIQTPSVLGPYIKFTIYSTNYNNTCMTGDTNWTFQSFVLSTITYSTPTPAPIPTPTSTAPTPTPDGTNRIIDNANQNTQAIIDNNDTNTTDIIENNNQNTQDIIDNNNQNTQDIIDNENENITCPVGPLYLEYDTFKDSSLDGKYLSSDGSLLSNNSYSISVYFKIKPNEEYKLDSFTTLNDRYFCFYNQQKTVISCSTITTSTVTSPSNSAYLRISLRKDRTLYIKGPICNDWKKEGLDKIADVMSDSSIDDQTGFFTNFNNDNHGLTGIISLPLTTIQSLANSSCVTLSLPVPFTNDNFTLPCMTQVYQSAVPDIYSMWQVVSFGIISYYICIDIFKMVKGFKDPNEDKIEVLDL